MGLNVAFATCVQLGLECIEEIYRLGGELSLLITIGDEQAPGKSGRVHLDEFARLHGVPLLKIKNINDQTVLEELEARAIDWLFIVGWSQIARPEVLETPSRGCIGIHPTLLPVGRGRASIPWAIIKGLDQTGVTMFKIDEGVDTGDIIGQESISLSPRITATELYGAVAAAHVRLIARYWPDVVGDSLSLTKQDGSRATVWSGRTPADGEILPHMTMDEADRLVRAVTHPYPGAFYKTEVGLTRVWAATFSESGGTHRLADGYITPTDFDIEQDQS